MCSEIETCLKFKRSCDRWQKSDKPFLWSPSGRCVAHNVSSFASWNWSEMLCGRSWESSSRLIVLTWNYERMYMKKHEETWTCQTIKEETWEELSHIIAYVFGPFLGAPESWSWLAGLEMGSLPLDSTWNQTQSAFQPCASQDCFRRTFS